jgi:hypothetical protein
MAGKIIEFKFTDTLGHEHGLRSSYGVDVQITENGALTAMTKPPGKLRTLTAAPGAWLAYRLEYAD